MAVAPLHPLLFEPIPFERPWGGSRLQTLYGKPGLAGKLLGETWEIADRIEAESKIIQGSWAGHSLRTLMESHRDELLGDLAPHVEPVTGKQRFPWLIKCLDCSQTLSLQVHPPTSVARRFESEPKTELWFVTAAADGACLWAGLENPVTLDTLAHDAGTPNFARHLHRIPVSAGDALFLPSGRLHAPGAGVVIFEVQENSDSTYRLYDWDRPGPDGKPRPLHIEQGLASLDLNDFRPGLVHSMWRTESGVQQRELALCDAFRVFEKRCDRPISVPVIQCGSACALGIVEGELELCCAGFQSILGPGRWVLLPACLADVMLSARLPSRWIWVERGGVNVVKS